MYDPARIKNTLYVRQHISYTAIICDIYDFVAMNNAKIMLKMFAGMFAKNKVPIQSIPELYLKNPVIARAYNE